MNKVIFVECNELENSLQSTDYIPLPTVLSILHITGHPAQYFTDVSRVIIGPWHLVM